MDDHGARKSGQEHKWRRPGSCTTAFFLASLRRAAASSSARAQLAIPSGSSAVARSIIAFCSSVTGIRR